MTTLSPAQPVAVSPIRRCPCGRRHRTNATRIRCWASEVWRGWWRIVLGDHDGAHALILEIPRAARSQRPAAVVVLYASTAERDDHARQSASRGESVFVVDIARPP